MTSLTTRRIKPTAQHLSRSTMTTPPPATGDRPPPRADTLLPWVQKVQATAPSSPERAKAWTQLISVVQQSGKLARPQLPRLGYAHPDWLDIYSEACWSMWQWAKKKIDDYNPNRALLTTWLNKTLRYRFLDAAKVYLDYNHPREHFSDQEEACGGNPIETLPNPDTSDPHMESLLLYLKLDPDGLLDRASQKHPHLTLRAIVLGELNGMKLNQIAEQLNINPPITLYSFYRRHKEALYESIENFHTSQV